MPKEGEIGAQLTSGAGDLAFCWNGDRFGHAINAGALVSQQHADFETPVFQEVHQQGELVFASGMSGDRHWSASIEASEEGFLFDVACRCKTPAAAIGSAYRIKGQPAVHVIGKAIDDAAPPTIQTVDATLAIESRPTVAPPATYRYRYAVVRRGSQGIEKERP